MSTTNLQNTNEASQDNQKKGLGSDQFIDGSTSTQAKESGSQQSTVNTTSILDNQKNKPNQSDQGLKNQEELEKKLQHYKSLYKNQKGLITNKADDQENGTEEQNQYLNQDKIKAQQKDLSIQIPKSNKGQYEITKEEDQGVRQKLFQEDAEMNRNQIQEKNQLQQIDIDTVPQSVDNNNFFNISQEIQIQGLQDKSEQQLVGINISPNSKITINRELSNSYFGDHDQDDRSIYHEQEKLYSPTLDKQKTTQSKNESELNKTSSPKRNKRGLDSDRKLVSEFEASSPKIIKNEIIGDTDTDKKINNNLVNSPTGSSSKDKDNNNNFQGRDNFKKLSLKMNQVPLDEDFKNEQQQQCLTPSQQKNLADQKNNQPKQFQKRKKSEDQLHKKDNQNKQEQNGQNIQGFLEQEVNDDDEEEEEYEEDEEEEEYEEEENNNIQNDKEILQVNEQKNQNLKQINQNGNLKSLSNNIKDEDKNGEYIDNGNLNYLSSEQYYEDLNKFNTKKSEEKPNFDQEIRVMQHDKQIYLRVSKIQEGIVTLISEDYSQVKMPLIFLPNDISCGSIVKLSIDREYDPEEELKQTVVDIQQQILSDPNYFQ